MGFRILLSYSLGFVLLLLAPIYAGATDYYMDATNGDDTNAGTSSAAPWKTLGKINTAMSTAAVAAGDNIYFKRGETFTGSLVVTVTGTVGNILTFSAYGTGDIPIIDAERVQAKAIDVRNSMAYLTFEYISANNATSEGFFLYNSGNNITISNAAAVNNALDCVRIVTGTFSDITIEDTTITDCADGIDVTSATTVNGLTIDNVTVSSGSIGARLLGDLSDDINILNSTFRDNSSYGIYMDNVSNVEITSTVVSNNDGRGILVEGDSSNITINDLTSSMNGNDNIMIGTDSASDITVQNSTFTGSLNGGNGFALSLTGSSITITNTTASNNTGDGFNIHDAWSNVTIDSCTANENGVDGLGTDGDGISFHETSSGTITKSIIRDNLKTGVANIDNSQVTIERSIFTHTTNGTLPLVYVDGDNHWIYNNTIYSAANTGTGVHLVSGTNIVKNNIIHGFDVGIGDAAGSTNTADYNLVYNATSYNWNGLTSGNSSVSSDPLFTDKSALDFTLLSGSPAIDAGAALGYTTDYAGNTISGLPDIGAYEHVSARGHGSMYRLRRMRNMMRASEAASAANNNESSDETDDSVNSEANNDSSTTGANASEAATVAPTVDTSDMHNVASEGEVVESRLQIRTCLRVDRRFGGNQKMLVRVNNRLERRWGFVCEE